jgi:glycosyltransferase involved in cell wall biosynthesis
MARVSVLVPCFNTERFIAATLQSLRSQSFTDWECIVVDDGSTDESAALIGEFARQDLRFTLLRQPNAGVAAARNAAFAASSAETSYVLFLDADDCLEPDMLQTLVNYLDQNPLVGMVYSAFSWFDVDDQPILADDPRLPDFLPKRFMPSSLGLRILQPDERETPFAAIYAAWCGILPSNALLRRSVYLATRGWDESLGQPAEDTDLFLQIALRTQVDYLPHSLIRYRRHFGQVTRDRRRILAQDAKLFSKWAGLETLLPAERSLVESARWFREGRVLPYVSATHGVAHIKHGHLVEGLKCFGRAGRQVVRSYVEQTKHRA